MRAIVYTETGAPDVRRISERPEPEPSSGEVLVRVAVSGVNPTDWKARRGDGPGRRLAFPEVVPNQDGAGPVVAVGANVDPARVSQRVWLWEAAWRRADGTAQELVALPGSQAVAMPDDASFDLGASLGIPALTAHRCLTVGVDGPATLGPGTLDGRKVLVAGGAGAVGHAAIELARWAGAAVIATVSSSGKAELAAAAGAHDVVNYRTEDAARAVRRVAPDGIDVIVEVAASANAALDASVIGPNGTVAIYASDPDDVTVRAGSAMRSNARYQFVLVYTVTPQVKEQAVRDVQAAAAA
ncbi:MAG TPA: NADPH:quinone reductase, partial [Actinomycetota bacterium]|nr:NADPH:quinone reductase [Actinomycetota bacterium]